MSEIIYVREERCEGCLYSPNSIDHDPQRSRAILKADETAGFTCHCFTGAEKTGKAVCRGFYDAHGSRLEKFKIYFTKKKGQAWQWWKHHGKPGSAVWQRSQ